MRIGSWDHPDGKKRTWNDGFESAKRESVCVYIRVDEKVREREREREREQERERERVTCKASLKKRL